MFFTTVKAIQNLTFMDDIIKQCKEKLSDEKPLFFDHSIILVKVRTGEEPVYGIIQTWNPKPDASALISTMELFKIAGDNEPKIEKYGNEFYWIKMWLLPTYDLGDFYQEEVLTEVRNDKLVNKTEWEVVSGKLNDEISCAFYTQPHRGSKLLDHLCVREGDEWDLMHKITEKTRSMHNLGIVHRDLRSENILIDNNGEVSLIDFGSSVDNKARNRSNDLSWGPVHYYAPIDIHGKQYHRNITKSWDIASIGLTLLEKFFSHRNIADNYSVLLKKQYNLLEDRMPKQPTPWIKRNSRDPHWIEDEKYDSLRSDCPDVDCIPPITIFRGNNRDNNDDILRIHEEELPQLTDNELQELQQTLHGDIEKMIWKYFSHEKHASSSITSRDYYPGLKQAIPLVINMFQRMTKYRPTERPNIHEVCDFFREFKKLRNKIEDIRGYYQDHNEFERDSEKNMAIGNNARSSVEQLKALNQKAEEWLAERNQLQMSDGLN